jgi:hypothetical protein
MSKTVTTTNIPHNDSPAIGKVEFRDGAIGKIIVSDQESREISASGTYKVRISVGRDLLEINMSASPDQYIKIKELVDQTRKDQNANNLLHKLAFLSADEAIASECKLGANKNVLKTRVSECLPSTVKGVLAWSPLEIWDAVPDRDLKLCCDALVLKLDELLAKAPLLSEHDRNTFLEKPSEAFDFENPVGKYLYTIAQSCMDYGSGELWPRSSFASLMKFSKVPYVFFHSSPYPDRVIATAIQSLTGDRTRNKESTIKIVEAVYKLEGSSEVLLGYPRSSLATTIQAKLGLNPNEPLASRLPEVPAAWIQDLPQDKQVSTSIILWGQLSDALKVDITNRNHVIATAIQSLTGDRTVNEESKIKIVEAVYQLEGSSAVLLGYPRSRLAINIQEKLGLDANVPLASCLPEVPAAWIQDLPQDKQVSTSISLWGQLSDALKVDITNRISENPSLLLTDRLRSRLPRELAKSISVDCVIDKLTADSNGLELVAIQLAQFRNLSKTVCKKLIDNGYESQVAGHLIAFRLSDNDRAEIIVQLLQKGQLDKIVEQLPSISDKVLQKVDHEGHSFLSFKNDCNALLPGVYNQYKAALQEQGPREAKEVGRKISAMLDSIIGYGPVLPEYKDDPIFQELCDFAYPQHVTKGEVAHCKDRSEDLELFEVPDKPAPLRLGGPVRLALRNNIKADNSVVSRVENLVRAPLKVSHDRDSAKKSAKQQLEQLCGLEGATDSHSLVVETLQLVPDEQLTPARVKRALVAYHASEHADFKQYAADSVDRAEQAPNRDYAYLLELRDFLTTAVTDSLIAAIDRNPSEDPSLRAKLVHTVHNIFSEEVDAIDKELSKYVALDERGKRTREISALFIKNQPSAAMRRVAGVCVAVDNPVSENKPNKNMWEMENYLQLVLRDEQTRRCVGGVLLHYYEEQDKRILTASLNPCSTLLYKVDEETMFSELLRVLGEFADKNDIDIIGVSVDRGIRTNRTGGLFEQALNRRIREINQKFHLVKGQPFSYRPYYTQQVLDIIWRKEDEQ